MDVAYFINEEKGIVVCKPESKYDELDFILDYIRSKVANPNFRKILGQAVYKRVRDVVIENDVSIGIARCMPEDEFNEQIGRKIAYDKLVRKLRARALRILILLSRAIDSARYEMYAECYGIDEERVSPF